MKKIISLVVLVILFFFGFKGWQYYSENDLYAHYISKAYWESLDSDVDNGYTDQTSYEPGELQKVYIDAKKSGQTYLKLYDVDNLAVDSVKAVIKKQDRGNNPSEEGYGYESTFTYEVPAIKSGLYLWEKSIPFIIKAKKKEEIVVLYPTNTINAYNITGGKSLYSLFSEQTHVVSFLRPTFPAVSFQVQAGIKYLKRLTNFPQAYITDQDMENYTSLSGAKLLIIIGHSEYWTRKARLNFDRFVESGGNVLILSGNTMWWQVRYENNMSQMVCYKELPDPVDDKLLTTTFWTNEILEYPVIPSIGVDFPHGGFGRKYEGSFKGLKVIAPNSPVFKETQVKNGQVIDLPTKEYDGTLLTNTAATPLLDTANLPFYKVELLAYDHAYSEDKGFGTFIIFQKTQTSGTIINTGTMDWCSQYGLGGKDSTLLEKITYNMIEGLLEGEDLFSHM